MHRAPLARSLPLALAILAQPVCAQERQRAPARPLTVVAWNVESGGADVGPVASRIARFQGVDVWGLSEVAGADWAARFETAAEEGEGVDFRRILGTTGKEDRLLIVYNAARLDAVRHWELHDLNVGGNVRAPLVAHLRERATGAELLFMVNHLYRGSEAGRHEQAAKLNAWAREQRVPVIAVGDFNFDWDVRDGDRKHDRGYDLLTQGGAFGWVRPTALVRSQCSARYDSVLDFVFVTPAARAWRPTSEIVVEPNDCGDARRNPDHRPVRAQFALGARVPVVDRPGIVPAPVTLRDSLMARIEAIEAELRALRALVERMP